VPPKNPDFKGVTLIGTKTNGARLQEITY